MSTIKKALDEKKHGLHYANRLILPFKCEFLKIGIEDDVITDFSEHSKQVHVVEHEDFTDIYFKDYKNLKDDVSEYEVIKAICVEKGEDIFDFKNHITLSFNPINDHVVEISLLGPDQIFID